MNKFPFFAYDNRPDYRLTPRLLLIIRYNASWTAPRGQFYAALDVNSEFRETHIINKNHIITLK